MPPKRGKAKQTPKIKKKSVEELEDDETEEMKEVESTVASLSSSLNSIVESQNSQREDPTIVLKEDYVDLGLPTSEIVKRLKKIVTSLNSIAQDDYKPDLWDKDFPFVFLDKKLMNSKDKEVKLRTACILADIFRLTAPEHPFSDDQVEKIFKLLISQLKGLEDPEDSLFSSYFYLLEKLYVTKAFTLLTFPEIQGESMIEELFEMFFSMVTSKYEEKVSHYMCEIMAYLIESLENISTGLLETIIAPLIGKNEDLSAYNLSRALLDKTTDYIVTNLSEYINKSLEKLDKTKSKFKSNRAHLFQTIFELNLISTRLLLFIIPKVAEKLKDEDDSERSATINLFGKMFSSKESSLINDYDKILEEFIGRFNDKDSEIRKMMIQLSIQLLVNHPKLAPRINPHLEERLQDQDEKVRKLTIQTVYELVSISPNLVDEKVIEKFFERFRDKKDGPRNAAIHLFSKIYKQYYLSSNDQLKLIPDKILSTFEDKSFSNDHSYIVEKSLVEDLLPKDDSRAEALCILYTNLSDMGKKSFKNFLYSKKRTRDFLKRAKDIEELTKHIAQAFGKKVKITEDIFTLFTKVLEDDQTKDDVLKLEKEIEKLKDESVKAILNQTYLNILTYDQIGKLLDSKNEDYLEFCQVFCYYFPSFLKHHVKRLFTLLKGEFKLKSLMMMKQLSEIDDSKIIKELKELLDHEDSKIVKNSIYILLKNVKDMKDTYDEIVSRLEDENFKHITNDLVILKQYGYLQPSTFKTEQKAIVECIIENISKDVFKTYGMKVLASCLDCISKEGVSLDSDEIQKKILSKMYECLDSTDSQLKLSASQALLKVASNPEYVRISFKLNEFEKFAFSILDKEVAKVLSVKLFQKIFAMKLPLKFVAMLLLSSNDKEVGTQVQSEYQMIAEKLFGYNKAQNILLSDPNGVTFSPEYILPPLIHLLVNHPNFENENPKFTSFTKILYHYFDVTFKENHSFFQLLINKLKEKKDTLIPDDTTYRVQKVCDLAFTILNSKASKSKTLNLEKFPGKIYLPPYFKDAEGVSASKFYLDPEFKLLDKAQLKDTGISPKKKEVGATPRKKKAGDVEQTPKSTGKRKKRTEKQDSELFSPTRSQLKRGAKKALSYNEEEKDDEDENPTKKKKVEEEKKPKRVLKKSKRSVKKDESDEEEEEEKEEEEEEEEKEEVKKTPSKRGRKKKEESKEESEEEKEEVKKTPGKRGRPKKNKEEEKEEDKMDEEEKEDKEPKKKTPVKSRKGRKPKSEKKEEEEEKEEGEKEDEKEEEKEEEKAPTPKKNKTPVKSRKSKSKEKEEENKSEEPEESFTTRKMRL